MVKGKWDSFGMIAAILGFVVSLAIGGAFINGSFVDGVILSWIPLLGHQIVGWTIVILTLVGAALGIYKRVK